MAQDRIVIVGAGHVGATAAYALMLRGLFREILLIDSDPALATAEAADIADADALARPTLVRAGSYADGAAANIAVITAGAATHGDESRLAVAGRSAAIVRSCVAALMAAGFDGIILVAANPVDLMAMVAQETSGLPASRVLGTGTLLDSGRLRRQLGALLKVAPASVEAMMLGEHGDSSFAALSLARVGGVGIAGLLASPAGVDLPTLEAQVREGGYRIIQGKGYTSFGVATAIVRICEAIVRDEKVALPVSVSMAGQFGLTGLHLSLPCILGANGVDRILEPALAEAEVAALHHSAAIIANAREQLDRHPSA